MPQWKYEKHWWGNKAILCFSFMKAVIKEIDGLFYWNVASDGEEITGGECLTLLDAINNSENSLTALCAE